VSHNFLNIWHHISAQAHIHETLANHIRISKVRIRIGETFPHFLQKKKQTDALGCSFSIWFENNYWNPENTNIQKTIQLWPFCNYPILCCFFVCFLSHFCSVFARGASRFVRSFSSMSQKRFNGFKHSDYLIYHNCTKDSNPVNIF